MTLTSLGWAPETWLTVTALSCSVEAVLVLRVVGEVDLATVYRLREQVHQYLGSDYRGVILDLTAVSFLAACGIGLLVEIAEQARAEGKTLRLVAQSRLVLRALEVASTNQLISRAPTVAEAVAKCAS